MKLVSHLIMALAVNFESFLSLSEESSGILPVPFEHQLRPSVEAIPSLPTYKKPKEALKHILTMSGHSHFGNIQHRKGRQDQKRSKNFEKCIREITVAAKMGLPDPNANPRLRQAIQAARKENLPRDKIEAAIKNAIGNAAKENYEEVQYEAYGPSGTALMIKVQTDNRNRISGYLRRVFNQRGGNLGDSGTVKHLFDHVGLIVYRTNETQFDDIYEFASDLDVIDIEEDADVGIAEITCDMKQFGVIRDALYKKFGDPELARLTWKPKNLVEITDKKLGDKLARLIEALEDIDDVQYVETNFSLPDRGETKD
ncbi:unnamed protein product [Bemisia tabaci]|uniref:Transcriptional regulatory protein n=2 Tax=Bemisia tabaci TaxID=7038 RepID=A0A9P0AH16_BEMTA|nr:unnamed protein product [Bemisia tabaci]